MRCALAQAESAGQEGEVPIGAVVVSSEDVILAQAGNSPVSANDPTGHAEILALRAAAHAIGNYRLSDADIYVTLEPCPMCAGAIVHSRIRRLIFGARDLRFGGVRSKFRIADSDLLNHQVEVVEGVLASDCVSILRRFFTDRR
ncbi:MAG: nucleoside deaminase [Bryobacteraceae bacterium]|nr:nucleoside deaminase [Bryobacteraceae bacterium]